MTSSTSQFTNSQQHQSPVISYRSGSTKTQIANGRYIAAGAIINSQLTASCLPSVNSVHRRRRSKAARQKLFNGNYLAVVSSPSPNTQTTQNLIVADNYLAA